MNFELPQTRTKYHQNTKLKNKDAISLQLIIYFRVEVEFNLYFNDLLTFDTNSKPKLVSLLEEEEYLTAEQEGDEFLMMGLRLKEGVDLNRYQKLTGHGLNPQRLEQLLEQKLLELRDERFLRATPDGALLLNTLVAELTA